MNTKEETDYISRAQEYFERYMNQTTTASHFVELLLQTDKWRVRDPAPGLLSPKKFEFFLDFVEAARPWGLQMSLRNLKHACKGFQPAESLIEKHEFLRKTEKNH